MERFIPKWNTLRVIGKSKLVTFTILVPFLGYLILFNNELIAYFSLSKELLGYPSSEGTVSPDTISRLYFLYYGLTVLGISSIAFTFFCPATIKEHETEFDFYNSEMNIMTSTRFYSLVVPLSKLLAKDSDEYKTLEGYAQDYRESFKTAERIAERDYQSILDRSK